MIAIPVPDPRPARKIDLDAAVAMLAGGQSKADVARHFGVSRSAVSQALKGRWPLPASPVEQARVDLLGQLEQSGDHELALALRRHAQITVEPALVRIVVKPNADARAALKALSTRRRDLASLWSKPIGVCW